jgi:hypothetical protein
VGRDGVSDAFYFAKAGSLSGQFDGGGAVVVAGATIAGADGFAVVRGAGDYVSFVPSSPAAGTTAIDGRVFKYAGMEPFSPVSGDAAHLIITGSAIADNVVLEDDGIANNGKMRVTFSGLNFWNGTTETHAVYDILVPAAALPARLRLR